jgi:hypothetical protein
MKLVNFLVTTLLFATTTVSAEPLIINPSNKASPATVTGMAFKNAVGGNWYQAKDCEDALTTFKNSKDAVMIYNSSIDFAARNKNINCSLQGVTAQQVVFVGYTYVNICRKPGSTTDLNSTKATLGMASMYAVTKHEKNFNTAGANIKLVPYGGSQEIVTAVRAGDIDLGWIGTGMAKKQGANLDCIYSTDPSAANFLGKKLNLAIPNFQITYVVYTNSTDAQLIEQLRTAYKNKEFGEFLNTSDTITNWTVRQKDIDEVDRYVNKMQTNWAD